MAFVTMNKQKLKDNFDYLDELFSKNGINWAVVSKVLCGNRTLLEALFELNIHQICDSRVTNLKVVKQLNPKVETLYIKPPAKRSIASIVRYADISFNTELATIQMLSDEAVKQGKRHGVIVMIEMGELREGVMRDNLMDFYEKVFNLPNIDIVGIGTNLSCLYGVLPNHDKLIQLSLYEQLIEARFNRSIPLVSGGSSVTIPLIHNNLLPVGINHFRVGETLFLGTDVYHDKPFENMHNDVFILYAEIIELINKPNTPMGDMGTNVEGKSFETAEMQTPETSCRAILDIGLLDVEQKHIQLSDTDIEIAGASSDMIVLDLGQNRRNYKVGDLVEFSMDYMGLLRILNSKYVEKKVV
ncbi:MAG: alanine racemase [Bacteroidales bacterium]|nr:alanine racemase [Bacteroidales bacterium]